jgi:Spy/CpxP family protein refolding chaperone
MNARRIAAATILLSAMAFAQTAQTSFRTAPGSFPPMAKQGSAFSKLMLPEQLEETAGFFDEQRAKLQKASTAQQLALIDDGADAMKSFVRLSAIVDAEPFDEAAYDKEATALAATAGKTVKNVAEMVAFRRRILTGDQYAKLRTLQKQRTREARRKREAERWKMHRRGAEHPSVPSSLSHPLQP